MTDPTTPTPSLVTFADLLALPRTRAAFTLQSGTIRFGGFAHGATYSVAITEPGAPLASLAVVYGVPDGTPEEVAQAALLILRGAGIDPRVRLFAPVADVLNRVLRGVSVSPSPTGKDAPGIDPEPEAAPTATPAPKAPRKARKPRKEVK
jgi:hypothetical protein